MCQPSNSNLYPKAYKNFQSIRHWPIFGVFCVEKVRLIQQEIWFLESTKGRDDNSKECTTTEGKAGQI